MAGMLSNDVAMRSLAYSGETLLFLLDDLALFGALTVLAGLVALRCLVGSQVIREPSPASAPRYKLPHYVPDVPLPIHAWHVGAFSASSARCSAAPEPSARPSATQREPIHKRHRRSPVVGSESKVTRRARPARRQRASSAQGEAITRNLRQPVAVCKSAHRNRDTLARFESMATIPEREIPTLSDGTVPARVRK